MPSKPARLLTSALALLLAALLCGCGAGAGADRSGSGESALREAAAEASPGEIEYAKEHRAELEAATGIEGAQAEELAEEAGDEGNQEEPGPAAGEPELEYNEEGQAVGVASS